MQTTRNEAEALRKEIKTHQQRLTELEHRLQLARGDLRRSEGQIDLIKDLLLRGETL